MEDSRSCLFESDVAMLLDIRTQMAQSSTERCCAQEFESDVLSREQIKLTALLLCSRISDPTFLLDI